LPNPAALLPTYAEHIKAMFLTVFQLITVYKSYNLYH
jgi:hypothetical protein